MVGRLVYPVANRLPQNIGVADRETHYSYSDFYWSSDSKAFLFLDATQEGASLILVTLDGDRVRTTRRPFPAADVKFDLVEIQPSVLEGYEITLEFQSKRQRLHSHDFEAVPMQVYDPEPPRPEGTISKGVFQGREVEVIRPKN